jgi:hypothetical protein
LRFLLKRIPRQEKKEQNDKQDPFSPLILDLAVDALLIFEGESMMMSWYELHAHKVHEDLFYSFSSKPSSLFATQRNANKGVRGIEQ